MKYDAVIFDLDGTLLDTIDDIADTGNTIRHAFGLSSLSRDDYKAIVGDGLDVMLNRLLPDDARPDGWLIKCIKLLKMKTGIKKTKIYEGIEEMLDGLISMGVKLAIFSNRDHKGMEKLRGTFLSKWAFDLTFGALDDNPLKPDPTVALKIAKQLGIKPERCIFVGDSNVDMQTAVSAKMCPVGVLWGFRPKEELLNHGAKYILKKPKEIFEII